MAKNDFLAKQKATNDAFFKMGLRYGRQQILDMMSIALRNPDVMGKDTFGARRLCGICTEISRLMDYYEPAFNLTDETDYYQAKMDEQLAEAYGEKLHNTFHERYDGLRKFDYQKGKWDR